MKNNDNIILELKQDIKERKSKLKKNIAFSPKTNLMFIGELPFSDKNGLININTLSIEELKKAYINIDFYNKAFKEKFNEKLIINDQNAEDFLEDIEAKIEIIKNREEKKKLVELEKKLDKLLSDDKKTELELDLIANLLKNG